MFLCHSTFRMLVYLTENEELKPKYPFPMETGDTLCCYGEKHCKWMANCNPRVVKMASLNTKKRLSLRKGEMIEKLKG